MELSTLFDTRFLTTDFRAIARVQWGYDLGKEVRKRAAKDGVKTKKLKKVKP